jgi:hypothetical protein
MNRIVVSLAALSATLVGACSRAPESREDTAAPAQSTAQTPDSTGSVMLRGTVVSVSGNDVTLKSDSGQTTAFRMTQPFHMYARVPGTLADVKQSSFVGVTSVKQPDGTERATEVHVFPEELRGVGEGSRMMTPPAANATASRMTNGNVQASRMTNGAVSGPSRMSNGNVASTNGSSLEVQYAGGSQTIVVPPNTPVTELKLSDKQLAPGDKVAVMAKKNADGSLTADKAISTSK